MRIRSTACDSTHCHTKKGVSVSVPTRVSSCPLSCHPKHSHDVRYSAWLGTQAVSAENGVAVTADEVLVLKACTPLSVSIREARNSTEFEQIGWLRARAYYATRPPHRFQQTFIKQFAQKEARSLIMRTRKLRDYTAPEIVCLVAVLPYSDPRTKNRGNVVGTVDIRPPRSARGEQPKGVPEDVENGAHLLNLVVDADWRRQGCGTLMMDAAEALVQKRWGAHRLYMEVAIANKEAQSLYQRLGYEVVNDGGGGENLLLCKQW